VDVWHIVNRKQLTYHNNDTWSELSNRLFGLLSNQQLNVRKFETRVSKSKHGPFPNFTIHFLKWCRSKIWNILQ